MIGSLLTLAGLALGAAGAQSLEVPEDLPELATEAHEAIWKLGLTPAPERQPPGVTPPEPPSMPTPEVHVLSGGGIVHILERPEIPLVRVEVSVTWAGQEACRRRRSAASLAGDVLGDATKTLDAERLASAAEQLGAAIDVGITRTRLWADVEVPRGSEAEAIALLAEAVRSPAIDRGETKRAAERWGDWRRDLWLDLRRTHERAENHAWFSVGHPARHQALDKDLRRLRARHVRRVHRLVTRKGQLFITVAGAADASIVPSLEAAFGDMRGDEQHVASPPPTAPAGGVWLVGRSGFDVAAITLLAPGPSWADPELAAAQVMMGIFAGDFSSRVEADLRETRGLTYGVDGAVQVWKNSGRLRVSLEVEEARTAEALVALREHVTRLAAEGVTEEEVRRAQRTLTLEAGRALQTNARMASMDGELWLRDATFADAEARLEAVRAVTAEEVSAAAARWYAADGLIWIVTGSRAALEQPMMDVGFRPDTLIDARSLSESR